MPRKLYCETIALPAGAKPWPRMQMSQYHSSRFFTRMMVDVSRAAVSQSAPRRAFMKYAIVAVLLGVAVVAAAQTSKKDGAAAAGGASTQECGKRVGRSASQGGYREVGFHPCRNVRGHRRTKPSK